MTRASVADHVLDVANLVRRTETEAKRNHHPNANFGYRQDVFVACQLLSALGRLDYKDRLAGLIVSRIPLNRSRMFVPLQQELRKALPRYVEDAGCRNAAGIFRDRVFFHAAEIINQEGIYNTDLYHMSIHPERFAAYLNNVGGVFPRFKRVISSAAWQIECQLRKERLNSIPVLLHLSTTDIAGGDDHLQLAQTLIMIPEFVAAAEPPLTDYECRIVDVILWWFRKYGDVPESAMIAEQVSKSRVSVDVALTKIRGKLSTFRNLL